MIYSDLGYTHGVYQNSIRMTSQGKATQPPACDTSCPRNICLLLNHTAHTCEALTSSQQCVSNWSARCCKRSHTGTVVWHPMRTYGHATGRRIHALSMWPAFISCSASKTWGQTSAPARAVPIACAPYNRISCRGSMHNYRCVQTHTHAQRHFVTVSPPCELS